MERSERNEIVDIVKSEIKKYYKDTLDDEVEKYLQKTTSKTRKEIIEIIKKSLESAFKMFWVKRDFWKTDIK